MKPNGYKKTIKQTMPNKTFVYWMVGLGLSAFGAFAGADEVLGHISDETESKTTLSSQAEDHANSDRKIIYRVICSPEDEQLPDCEKPFHDVETERIPQLPEENPGQINDVEQTEPDAKPVKQPEASKVVEKKPEKSKTAGKKQSDGKKSKLTTKNSVNKKPAKKATQTTSKKTSSKKK